MIPTFIPEALFMLLIRKSSICLLTCSQRFLSAKGRTDLIKGKSNSFSQICDVAEVVIIQKRI
jgi:hypothetical protein